MKALEYILQDVKWHFNGAGVLYYFARYLTNSSFHFSVLLRLKQLNRFLGVGYNRFCNRLNISVPSNVHIGEGICFPHGFPLVINGGSVIGNFVTINPNVLIGGNRKVGKSPIIEDLCYIGNGVKIIGDVRIGRWTFIAPGAIVTKSIPERSVVGFGLNNIISNNGRERVWDYLSEKIKNKILEDERNNGH